MTAATIHTIVQHIHSLANDAKNGPVIIALAGPPGCGKSTLSAQMLHHINLPSCVVPMDGFHLPNDILHARGWFAQKGAPETFDLTGFRQLIERLRAGSVSHFPTFDRDCDSVITKGGSLPANIQVIIVEGNYLLFNEPDWAELATLWDASIWLDVPVAELEARLMQRWLDQGLSPQAAYQRTYGNDMVNVQRVLDNALPGTWVH